MFELMSLLLWVYFILISYGDSTSFFKVEEYFPDSLYAIQPFSAGNCVCKLVPQMRLATVCVTIINQSLAFSFPPLDSE